MPLVKNDYDYWTIVWLSNTADSVLGGSGSNNNINSSSHNNNNNNNNTTLSSSSSEFDSSSFTTTITTATAMMLLALFIIIIVWIICFTCNNSSILSSTKLVNAFSLPRSSGRRQPNRLQDKCRTGTSIHKSRSSSSSSSSGLGTFYSALWRHWQHQRKHRLHQQRRNRYTHAKSDLEDNDDDDAGGREEESKEYDATTTTTTTTTTIDSDYDDYDKLFLDDDTNEDEDFLEDMPRALFAVEGGLSSSSTSPVDVSPHVTHFCFLLHGHRGLSRDLRYMQIAMRRVAAKERRRRWQQAVADATTTSATTTMALPNLGYLRQDVVIHASVCNEHKTTDGVRNGGERLVEEMLQVIAYEMEKRPLPAEKDGDPPLLLQDITISIVGNSLGGLFGRYAIAKLMEQCTPIRQDSAPHGGKYWVLQLGSKNGNSNSSKNYRVHLNVFCTTATPHLGVSGHTYVQIPRAAEIGVAHAMGDTGKDLFRVTDLIHTMATCPSFLRPLASFRKRIAYANAYGTDFPVPAATAAFLSERSTYPHHFVPQEQLPQPLGQGRNISNGSEDGSSSGSSSSSVTKTDSDEEDDYDDRAAGEDNTNLIIATLHTMASHNHHDEDGQQQAQKSTGVEDPQGESKEDDEDDEDELHRMSKSLDQLGWKKVFVDVRRTIPSVELPQLLHIRRRQPSSLPTSAFPSDRSHDCYLQTLRQHKSVVPSKDICSAVSTPPKFDRLQIPLGHNMMVAFSRSPFSTSLYKGGRPVVDALAKELVEDIFTWDTSSHTIDNSLPSSSSSSRRSFKLQETRPKVS
jgi:hypothetical protein